MKNQKLKRLPFQVIFFVSLKKFEYKILNSNHFVGVVLKDHNGVIEISDNEI